MRLDRVTITGADESVTPYDLCALYDEFPFVEWGILCSASREGKEARYPAPEWIDKLLDRSHTALPLAAHLCGQFSRDAIGGPFLWAVERHHHWRRFSRVQFNGAEYAEATFDRVLRYLSHFPGKDFIVPVRGFWGVSPRTNPRFPHLLLDNSGGRGVELTAYPDPAPGTYCGYSGGIGPETIRSVLEAVCDKPDDAPFWIDMESNVRSEVGGRSVLDLWKVRFCLEISREYVG